MTSSMLSGEKRWTSARRGGMTVLGKVAVPKPINLPSQRLENHGLDPNVEIVPKGTLSWGSRPSSSSSNAWSSSALSPNTDGGTGSPRHLSGRPSSGGSGTRPSTAGSDKAHEPIAKARGSDSRPSSASGALASTQTSLTPLRPRSAETRPRSAETRPRSSQLSRFAEPLSDKAMTWSASAAAEKLGVVSSKNDKFSLSAGDFPTLGSEKETSAKNVESQDRGPYSRPGSSSGDTLGKEGADNSMGDIPPSANVKFGTGPQWRRDNFPYNEEGTRPVVEKWHADNQSYPNSSIPPQHYDGWHSGPPANNHPGGWYPGPPGGSPFGPPVPSGGFPMESFPYYRPQIPPGAGPRGPPPKNGDMYRPHLHDAYMRPGMTLRPGFYPGHLPYEGYYGPPMGFPNPNEPDIPFMGMPVATASYNRFADQHAPDTGNSHRRSSGYGPAGKAIVSEQVESGHSRDARGPYRVLLKHRDGWEGNDEERKWDDSMIMKSTHPVKGEFPGKSSWENNDLRTDEKNHQEMDTRKMVYGDEVYSESASGKGGISTEFKSPEDAGSSKVYDDSTVKKPRQMENAACAFPGSSIATSDSSLIQKIEGLNAKTRASDGRQDVKSAIGKVDCNNNLQTGNSMSNQSANEPVGVSLSVDRTHVSGTVVTHDHCSPADKNFKLMGASGTATTGISTHSMHVGADHRNKERYSTQEAERWRKLSHVADSSNAISSLQFGSSFVHGQDHTSVEVTERSRPYTPGRNDEDSVPHNADRTDSLAQRAKMKELAKQRLKQREEEEEERTRDQKAKALAKLEELNRRSLVGEDTTQKSETAASAVTGDKQEESGSVTENTSASVAGANPSVVRATRDDKSIVMSSQVEESVVVINRSQPLQLDVSNADGASHSSSSKQKRAGYKQKQNSLLGNTSNEKLVSSSKIEASKNAIAVVANVTVSVADVPKETESNCESCLTVSSSAMVEPSVHHKKKNRGGKNRQKAESSLSYALPSIVSKDPTVLETSVESAKAETVESVLDPSSVQSFSQTEDVNVVLKKHLPIPNEEMQTKPINQWKSHHSRKMPRDIQANKSTEKSHNGDAVFWAPVLPRNKPEVADGTNQKSVVEVASSSIKSDQQGQNNPRYKRAEMERYVPKPVAKEMAQQGGAQQSLAPINNQSTPDEAVVKGESGSPGSSQTATAVIGKLLSSTESRNGDGRRNKSGKMHGSWRQRGSVESTFTNPGTSVPKSVDHDQSHSPDASSGKEYSSSNVEWSTSDGWNMPGNCEDPVKMSFTKDHNVIGRVKRQAHKGHRGMRYNNDPDVKRVNRLDSENFHALSSISEMQQADSLTTTKDNHSVGLSHWQPKTQGHSTTNQWGSRARSDHNIGAEIVKGNNRDTTPPSGVSLPPETDTEYTAAESKSYQDRSTSEKGDLEEARNDGHHEARRGRNVNLHKGRPGSPVEQTFSADFRNEHRASSGFRKNINQNSRFGKDSESHGDWSESGKDKKQHTVPANWQRQRHHSHFEYQPVGPQNSNKAKFEVSKDGSYNSGSRYRDKSNSYSRRGGGNFYGRQSGSSSQVESSYDYRPNSS